MWLGLMLSLVEGGDGFKWYGMALNSGAKILVIDDEPGLLRSITAYLEDSGFVAIGAENGKQGLDLFNREVPDLVLTDLHMPVLGGLEVLSTITKRSPDTPVLVISGAGELNDAIEALRLGARDYITKPVSDMAVLEHAINKALERKKLIEENKIYAQKIEHNLKVLEEDQAAGRTVQQSMLPPEHLKLNDFECSYRVIASLELSGDFVEYFVINENCIGVYLADVSGHGASSAFVTVLLKSLINQYQVHYKVNKNDAILNPAKIMQALSDEIFSAKLSKYITLIYGVIDTSTSEFTYGIGGHYPNPILYSQDGTAKFLTGSGFPIGIVTPVEYQQQTVKVEKGEQLILLSDGVMEVFMHGSTLDEKDRGLLEVVKTSKGDIPAMLRGCGVTTKTNLQQPDDITILVISHK